VLTDMWSISARALATRLQTDGLVRSQDEESLGEKRGACDAPVTRSSPAQPTLRLQQPRLPHLQQKKKQVIKTKKTHRSRAVRKKKDLSLSKKKDGDDISDKHVGDKRGQRQRERFGTREGKEGYSSSTLDLRI